MSTVRPSRLSICPHSQGNNQVFKVKPRNDFLHCPREPKLNVDGGTAQALRIPRYSPRAHLLSQL